MRTAIAACFCWAAAIAAPAQAQIALEPGQAITIEIHGEGDVKVTNIGRAELADYDRAFLEQIRAEYKAGKEYSLGRFKDAPPIPPDALGLRFLVIDGKETVLAIENGYGDGIRYRATIQARGQSKPTDVCLVLPKKRGYEHWPYPIERIELRAFTRVAWSDGDPVPCV